MPSRTHGLVLALTTTLLLALAGCGADDDAGITEDSSCTDFLAAPQEDQISLSQQLAGKYRKSTYATPLGLPAVPHYCASHPDTTLKEFFSSIAE